MAPVYVLTVSYRFVSQWLTPAPDCDPAIVVSPTSVQTADDFLDDVILLYFSAFDHRLLNIKIVGKLLEKLSASWCGRLQKSSEVRSHVEIK